MGFFHSYICRMHAQPAVFAGPLSCGTRLHVLETVPSPQLMFFILWLSFAYSHLKKKKAVYSWFNGWLFSISLPTFLRTLHGLCIPGGSRTHFIDQLAMNLWPPSCFCLPNCGITGMHHQAHQHSHISFCFFEGMSLSKHEMAYASGNEPEMQRKYL